MTRSLPRARRLLAAAAVSALATAGLAGLAAPAQAAANCTGPYYAIYHSGGQVVAEADKVCNGEVVNAYASVQRLNPATGTWTILAGHMGQAVYTCVGTASNTYRVGGTSAGAGWYPFTAACG
ncbi:hypothetical protein AB0M43_03145 [Longispora sp. NPDC051575]|uniref:hypothetical protein n=1 Tax=Longispora sp. NPDC051575 TaxID=3154943 RepID=UPI003442597F